MAIPKGFRGDEWSRTPGGDFKRADTHPDDEENLKQMLLSYPFEQYDTRTEVSVSGCGAPVADIYIPEFNVAVELKANSKYHSIQKGIGQCVSYDYYNKNPLLIVPERAVGEKKLDIIGHSGISFCMYDGNTGQLNPEILTDTATRMLFIDYI